jgi:uncharacterized metal-binding protein
MAKDPPFRIYFACVGNSSRSQMAHRIAEHLGADLEDPLHRDLGFCRELRDEIEHGALAGDRPEG